MSAASIKRHTARCADLGLQVPSETNRMKYVINVNSSRTGKITLVGPYSSMLLAEACAKAWDGTDGRTCWVDPVVSPEDYLKREQRRKSKSRREAA